MANVNLCAAKVAKNDEFYTQLAEIQAELKNYTDKFESKIVFCNCDDPFESNFVKYFLMNFNRLKLKELIATGYKTSPIQGSEIGERGRPYALRVTNTKSYLRGTQTDLDIKGAIQFLKTEGSRIMTPLVGNWAVDENGEQVQIEIKEEYQDEKTGKIKSRKIKQDLYYEAGDFRSDMSIELLKQADIVVTNPPFSLFREYVAQLVEYGKEFLIIGNMNAITYKEIFPLLKDNQMWLGYKTLGSEMYFSVPDDYKSWLVENKKEGSAYKIIDAVVMGRMAAACWFTNIDHEKRHKMLRLELGYKYYGHEEDYPKYDNYNAINVDKVSQIPHDYMGVMGVPITFMDKYCPDQFEIIGHEHDLSGTGFGEDVGQFLICGVGKYKRILIRRK